jgi:hypothetical protein
MKYLIIYLIGFFISYYLIRKHRRNQIEKYEWSDVCIIFVLSLFSYIMILVFIINTDKLKVPKWL